MYGADAWVAGGPWARTLHSPANLSTVPEKSSRQLATYLLRVAGPSFACGCGATDNDSVELITACKVVRRLREELQSS